MKKTDHNIYSGQAHAVVAGGASCRAQCLTPVSGTPLMIVRGKGAKIYDCHDREYTDYYLNDGAHILGHANRAVVLAVKKHAERGWGFGTATRAEVDLAGFLTDHIASLERVRFVNSTTEAVMCAVQLARRVTGRAGVIRFDGAYHGCYQTSAMPSGHGSRGEDVVVPYNDSAAFEQAAAQYGAQTACVLVEPVAVRRGIVHGTEEFFATILRCCRAHGMLMIGDETMTGFRGFRGCACEAMNIYPDLICLGGVIGGGLPLGAYGGPSNVMRHLAPDGEVLQAETLAGNPVILRAGMMALRLLTDDFYQALDGKAEYFADQMNAFFASEKIDRQVARYYSMFNITPGKTAVSAPDLPRVLLSQAIVFPTLDTEPFFISGGHTRKDLQRLIEVLEAFFI